MTDDITAMTAEIVSAYVVGNKVSSEDVSGLIKSVFQSLSTLGEPAAEPVAEGPAKATNAQIRKSITPDALISFEDGKRYKTLKRHLYDERSHRRRVQGEVGSAVRLPDDGAQLQRKPIRDGKDVGPGQSGPGLKDPRWRSLRRRRLDRAKPKQRR